MNKVTKAQSKMLRDKAEEFIRVVENGGDTNAAVESDIRALTALLKEVYREAKEQS